MHDWIVANRDWWVRMMRKGSHSLITREQMILKSLLLMQIAGRKLEPFALVSSLGSLKYFLVVILIVQAIWS